MISRDISKLTNFLFYNTLWSTKKIKKKNRFNTTAILIQL